MPCAKIWHWISKTSENDPNT